MMHFIYVFSESDKEKLLSEGYELLREDTPSQKFVFIKDENKDMSFDLCKSLDKYFLSNTLTF